MLEEFPIGTWTRSRKYDFAGLPIGGVIDEACPRSNRHAQLWNALRQYQHRQRKAGGKVEKFKVTELHQDGKFWGIRVRKII